MRFISRVLHCKARVLLFFEISESVGSALSAAAAKRNAALSDGVYSVVCGAVRLLSVNVHDGFRAVRTQSRRRTQRSRRGAR